MPRKQKLSSISAHVALLRGVNVGGKNRLSMAELAELFRAAGCAEVSTYIQSGNVVFVTDARTAERIPGIISEALAGRIQGMRIPVIVRSAREIQRIATSNPYLQSAGGPEEKSIHVVFLDRKPSPSRVRALDGDRSPGDSFTVRGREIFLYLPNGVARTKLTNVWFDSMLGVTSTVRNWRTVQKLLEMANAVEY